MMHRSNKFVPLASALVLLASGPVWAAAAGDTTSGTSMTGSAAQMDVAGLRALDDDDTTVRDANGLTADELEDMDVVNGNGDTVGEIEDVLVNQNNEVVAFTVDAGGFLGMGEKEVVIGADQLQLQGDRFMTTMTSEQLEQQPEWRD